MAVTVAGESRLGSSANHLPLVAIEARPVQYAPSFAAGIAPEQQDAMIDLVPRFWRAISRRRPGQKLLAKSEGAHLDCSERDVVSVRTIFLERLPFSR